MALYWLARLHHSGIVHRVEGRGDRVAAVSRPPVVTSRRTALGGALAGVLALSACDVDGLLPGDEQDPAGAPEEPAPDADAALVQAVREEITAADVLLAELLRQQPALRGRLRPLRRMHTAHAEALEGFAERLPADLGPVSARRGVDVARRAEKALQARLAQASVEAESGALARLFASMAASVAQHLAVWA